MSEAYVCSKYFYGSCLKIDSTWLPAVAALASWVNVHCKHGSSEGQLRKCERVLSGRASPSTALGTLRKRCGNSREDKARVVMEGHKKDSKHLKKIVTRKNTDQEGERSKAWRQLWAWGETGKGWTGKAQNPAHSAAQTQASARRHFNMFSTTNGLILPSPITHSALPPDKWARSTWGI